MTSSQIAAGNRAGYWAAGWQGRSGPRPCLQATSSGINRHLMPSPRALGAELPELSQLPGLNEFDHTRVIEALKPAWADREAMAQELAGHDHPAKAFQLMFAEAVRRWVSDENAADYPESWSAFRERVLTALRQATAAANGGDILVVSSGGPIAVVMQAVLGLTDDRALALNEVIANTSVTRLLFSGERMSLSVFNSYEHLENESPALVTFR